MFSECYWQVGPWGGREYMKMTGPYGLLGTIPPMPRRATGRAWTKKVALRLFARRPLERTGFLRPVCALALALALALLRLPQEIGQLGRRLAFRLAECFGFGCFGRALLRGF